MTSWARALRRSGSTGSARWNVPRASAVGALVLSAGLVPVAPSVATGTTAGTVEVRCDASAICETPYQLVVSSDGYQRYRSAVHTWAGAPGERTYVSYDVRKMQYKWGLAWHDNTYPTTFSLRAVVRDAGGKGVRTATAESSTRGTTAVVSTYLGVLDPPGRYRVEIFVLMQGMYWGDTSSQVVDQRTVVVDR